MLHGQKFDPCKRTFFMKRAGHLFKENSHCSMFGALCPSNKLLVCADLKRSAKKLEKSILQQGTVHVLAIRFIYKQYVHMYIYNVYMSICIHVALLTNLQTDCLKPDIFILGTDLCPFHDCVSCSLHATCHLF